MNIKRKIERIEESLLISLTRNFHIRPDNICDEDIKRVLKYIPRVYWRDIIQNLIWKFDKNKMYVLCYTEKHKKSPRIDTLYFTLDDLDKDYYDIKPGDIITHKKLGGIYVSYAYVSLDKRYEEECGNNKEKLAEEIKIFGTTIGCEGLNAKGVPTGLNWGDYSLIEDTASYYNFKHLDYEPKEGEFLYYLKKSIKGEIHWKDEWKLDNLGSSKTHIKYDANHRKVYESWFKEYD